MITLKDAKSLVNKLRGAFKTGSTVCLHLPNDILYPVLVLGILAAGARWTGTNTAYTVGELKHHFKTSLTEFVITAEDHYETVRAAIADERENVEVIMYTDLLDAFINIPKLIG